METTWEDGDSESPTICDLMIEDPTANLWMFSCVNPILLTLRVENCGLVRDYLNLRGLV